MKIYDINTIDNSLDYDFPFMLENMRTIYWIEFKKYGTTYIPKTLVVNHWASNASKEAFNKLIPTVKSLIKDMYCIIESVYKSQTGNFDIRKLSDKYKHLKEFRLLNNKLKHFNDKEAEINLLELVHILPMDKFNLIDVKCTFKYSNYIEVVGLSDFIEVFLTILEDEKIISINRN